MEKINCRGIWNFTNPGVVSHNKIVSNVKFLDSTNFVPSSIDGTLKLWDLLMRIGGDNLQTYSDIYWA